MKTGSRASALPNRNSLRLAIASGFLIGTSYIPFPPWAILFCFLPLWTTWLSAKSAQEIFWTGWTTQFLLTLIGFNWVSHTVHEFGHLPWPVAIVVLGLFCALANIYVPVSGMVWFWFSRRLNLSPQLRLVALPVFVASGERLVPQIFDWHFGYTWLWAKLPGFHLADVIGFAGLSTFGILCNGCLLYSWSRYQAKRPWLASALVVPILFMAVNGLGFWRKSLLATPDKTVRVLLVQANIGNQEKLMAETGAGYRDEVINQFVNLSKKGLSEVKSTDYLIWPETAFPEVIFEPSLVTPYAAKLRAYVNEMQTRLITGGYSQHEKLKRITNSFFVLNKAGTWADRPYHKTMLLAFGEYMPFGEWIPKLYELFPEVGLFGRGPGPSVLNSDGLKIGAQICYEGLFDWFSRDLANKGAQVIVNLTNDSWYDEVEEPFQHGFMTLARAVEVRRPLVRSTNTGISTVILASGEVLQLSPLFKEWYHLYEVPYLSTPPVTPFMTWGYWLFPVLLGFSIVIFTLLGVKNRSQT
jgi:apolipoprotein N-acyltransferase